MAFRKWPRKPFRVSPRSDCSYGEPTARRKHSQNGVNSVRHRSGPIGVRPLIAEVASLGALGRRPCGSGGHPGGSETMSIAQRAGCATPGKPPDTIGGEENPVAIGTTWTRFRLPAHAGAADGRAVGRGVWRVDSEVKGLVAVALSGKFPNSCDAV